MIFVRSLYCCTELQPFSAQNYIYPSIKDNVVNNWSWNKLCKLRCLFQLRSFIVFIELMKTRAVCELQNLKRITRNCTEFQNTQAYHTHKKAQRLWSREDVFVTCFWKASQTTSCRTFDNIPIMLNRLTDP